MDTILGVLPGESYSGIRALADLSMCVKYTNTGQPVGPFYQPILRMLVLHRLRVCIYAVLSSQFDLRAQN